MTHYPINLDLTGKKAVVVGGGHVASRRIAFLLQSNACVSVVSPDVSNAINQFIENRQVTWYRKNFEPEDIIDAFIVIAATNDKDVNRQIADSAGSRQLVNVVSQPELGNFEVPAVLKRGKLTISVSTNGASPSLAKKIRDNLSDRFDESYDDYLEFLFTCRKKIQESSLPIEDKKTILNKLLDPVYQNPQIQDEILASFEAFIEDY
ncbi:NAD(P)-binding protein [Scopulibacillus cellulosilyticus]|uniref:precorrin-2 dehydrogenase n=1 Tax=Scopulibacillus cellulosilyticus TaxID=2665665 RepID=A0ABW2Q0X9_9BACL